MSHPAEPIAPVPAEVKHRLDQVLPRLSGIVRPHESPIWLESESNDVWQIGKQFLRICWRGDRERLRREAMVASQLPPEIPYPVVRLVGGNDELSWMVTERVSGAPLSELWSRLKPEMKREAARQYAAMLQALHAWRPPAEAAAALRHSVAASSGYEAIIGSDANPMPLERVFVLMDAAFRLPFADIKTLQGLKEKLHKFEGADPFATEELVVVHGDASFANVLWDDNKITALLDFEWARFAPRDLELLHILGTEGLNWLKHDYPELFEHPRLVEHLWIYDVASTLRGLLVWPPENEREVESNNSMSRLRTLLQGTSAIEKQLSA
jgi:aminoglycoside phosphotransferase